MSDKLKARIIRRRVSNPGEFLKVETLGVVADTHEGKPQQRVLQCVERGDAVAILPYDPVADEVILGNEMRIGMLVRGDDPYRNALAAGGMKPGESAIDVALRETREELNLELCDPKVIFNNLYSSPGGSSERVSIVFGIVSARQAGGVHGLQEEHESIKTVKLRSAAFFAQIDSGEINTMKTVLAGYWLKENRDRLMRDYNPWHQLARQLKEGAPAKDCLQSLRDFAWAHGQHGYMYNDVFVSGSTPAQHLVPLLLASPRAAKLIRPVHAVLQQNPPGDSGYMYSYSLSAEIYMQALARHTLTGMADPFDHQPDQRRRLTTWLQKEDRAFTGLLLDEAHRQLVADEHGHMTSYVSFPSGLARLVKAAGGEAHLAIWLSAAEQGVRNAVKNPDATLHDDSDSGPGTQVIRGGHLRQAQAHLLLLQRATVALEDPELLNVPVFTPRRLLPVRGGPA